jgi:UDP-N-acetyl-D-glucosamine dehydrogenase
VALTPEIVSSYDAVLIATDHDNVDYAMVAEYARIVVDTRNSLGKAGLANDRTVKA